MWRSVDFSVWRACELLAWVHIDLQNFIFGCDIKANLQCRVLVGHHINTDSDQFNVEYVFNHRDFCSQLIHFAEVRLLLHFSSKQTC